MGKTLKTPERARLAAVHRTIPNSRKSLAVPAGAASLDLGACTADDGPNTATVQDVCGVYVYLSAETADVTIQRGDAPATAGDGFVLVAGAAPQEFFIDPDGSKVIHCTSGAAATLHVTWDSEQVGT